jgi:hypothetical protein
MTRGRVKNHVRDPNIKMRIHGRVNEHDVSRRIKSCERLLAVARFGNALGLRIRIQRRVLAAPVVGDLIEDLDPGSAARPYATEQAEDGE